jgi:hypothetical protein
MLGMAGLGLLQGKQAQDQQKKQNKLNAELSAAEQQYSPWSGIKPSSAQLQAVDQSAPLTGAIGGAFSGYMQDKNFEKADQNKFASELAQKTMQDQLGGWAGIKPTFMQDNMGRKIDPNTGLPIS